MLAQCVVLGLPTINEILMFALGRWGIISTTEQKKNKKPLNNLANLNKMYIYGVYFYCFDINKKSMC